LGVNIVGVSFNDASALDAWANDQDFLFELWQDTNKSLAIYYGAASSSSTFFPDRMTVVLNESGEQILRYGTDQASDVGAHPTEVLADLSALFGD
jgi:peroxiredoxin